MKIIDRIFSKVDRGIVYIYSKRELLLKGLLLFFYFAILFANSLHEKYPDEFDNILGGKLILQGVLPYSGFFSHHGPVPYFLAAVIYLFSGASFVKFRILYSVFLFFLTIGTYIFLRKSVGKKETNFYLWFTFLVGIASSYFWGHMLIADALAAYFFIPVLGLIILKTIYKQEFSILDFVFISIFLALVLLTSLTYVYLVLLVYAFCLYMCFKPNTSTTGSVSRRSTKALFIFGAPYLFFLLYLFVTKSFSDYIYQSITFNQKYYIYNYPMAEGVMRINPIRYAIVILHTFYNNFYNLLLQTRDFNFAFPFNITLGLANVSLIGYLLLKRKYMLAGVFFLSLAFANARSSPLDSSEKDYQGAVYMLISFFSMTFFFSKIFEELKTEEHGKKLLLSTFFVLLGVYSFFMTVFIVDRFKEKVYLKYMGLSPLIYNRPELAPILNKITDKNDYVWIGPLEFEEYIYLQGKLASKYHFLIPGMGRSEKIQTEILRDFNQHKPKIVYLDKRFNILGQSPERFAGFFLAYLQDNYITLYEYREKNMQYKSKIGITDKIDLETKLYIYKASKDEVIKKLLSENLIEKVPQNK